METSTLSRWLLRLSSEEARAKAALWLSRAPLGMTVEFRQERRSTEQNALLWQRLTDLSEQVMWAGQRLSPTDWKAVTTASLRKCQFVPGIDPGTVVPLGLSTSSMTKAEMNDLLALIEAFGAEHGVSFTDHNEVAA